MTTIPPRPATLSPEASAYVCNEALQSGVHYEYSYRARWDADRRMVVEPELIFRGSTKSVRQPLSQFDFGMVALHTHPFGWSLDASVADLDSAAHYVDFGISTAIATNDGAHLRMLTEPQMLRRQSATNHDAIDALYAGRRRVSLGSRYLELVPKLRQLTVRW